MKKNDIDQLVRKPIRGMKEIPWGDIPDNNPYRLMYGENQQSVDAYKEAIIKEVAKINLYPSTTKLELRQKIAEYNNVKSENIFLTNGSDEALELIAKVFINEGEEVLIPSPSFPVFISVSEMMGANIIFVKLEKDFFLDGAKLLQAVTKKTKVIWIANPNNPTGNLLLTKQQIENIAKKINCILLIDECYFEFSQVTASDLIQQYPNIIITRSFSEVFALAGARLGYLIANEKVTTYFNRLQLSSQVFSVNRLAYAAGNAVMSDLTLMQNFLTTFLEMKRSFEEKLQAISLEVLPTQTAFSFVKLPDTITGKELKEKLLQKGIYIKDCSIYPNLGKQYIYLGIPKKDYQKKFIDEVKRILDKAYYGKLKY